MTGFPEEILECVCSSVKNKANFMEVSSGNRYSLYHKRCPTHGVEIVDEFPMMEVRVQEIFSKKQLILLAGRLYKPVLVKVLEGGNSGIIEFSRWRFMTDEEKEKYKAENSQ